VAIDSSRCSLAVRCLAVSPSHVVVGKLHACATVAARPCEVVLVAAGKQGRMPQERGVRLEYLRCVGKVGSSSKQQQALLKWQCSNLLPPA
jgi:hypothetical protein